MVFYLNIGTNLGDKEKNLADAISHIESATGSHCRRSDMVSSEPWGFESENRFVNVGVAVESMLEPLEMLQKLKAIEREMGSGSHRSSDGSYCDRLIDIDIMAVDEMSLHQENLTIPHPHLTERDFFLVPLAQLAPDWEHPELHLTMAEMLQDVNA